MTCERTCDFEDDSRVTKTCLARSLVGGVIMDVMNVEQALIAQEAGACAVMALEKIPADIRMSNGVARMSDPGMIAKIQKAVSIPVMAKCRIGHFAEAQILQELKVDFIDESEVLTIADNDFHIEKEQFKVPFVCGCRNLGEALRRITEGAAMIRTKGEAGTGDIVEAVRHIRTVDTEIKDLKRMTDNEMEKYADDNRLPLTLVQRTRDSGKLPVVNFAAGGIATPADASLCMQLGVQGVFVGSGIFKGANPKKRAHAIVQAVTHYCNSRKLLEVSTDLGEAMVGISNDSLTLRFANREAVYKS